MRHPELNNFQIAWVQPPKFHISLKKSVAFWELSQIHICCASAPKRLEAVVEAEGGYIEDE